MAGILAIDQPILFVALAHQCGLTDTDIIPWVSMAVGLCLVPVWLLQAMGSLWTLLGSSTMWS